MSAYFTDLTTAEESTTIGVQIMHSFNIGKVIMDATSPFDWRSIRPTHDAILHHIETMKMINPSPIQFHTAKLDYHEIILYRDTWKKSSPNLQSLQVWASASCDLPWVVIKSIPLTFFQ